jgi:cystathionine gamma-lyase
MADKISTVCVHAGQPADPSSGAVMMPIVLASTFAQDGPGVTKGYDYSRAGNPTRTALEACLAALEGGTDAIAFASGCAATTTLLLTLKSGDHVVASDDVYGGTFRIFDKVMKDFGIEATFVDMTDIGNVQKAMRKNTRLVWMETPSNPMLKIIDIAGVAEISRAGGAELCVDNTFATPILQRPLELGATLVLHSMTKYLNGHSDVVAGCIVTRDKSLGDKLHFLQKSVGAVPSPFDCYMVLRGLKTLAVRMERHVRNARAIAEHLASDNRVKRVIFPGLSSHPGHALASKQMSGPGGMISFDLTHGTLAASTAFLKALRVFACAESLGGVESLAEHPALMTHASLKLAARRALGIGDGFIRLSIGIEDASDLQEDLERALHAAG